MQITETVLNSSEDVSMADQKFIMHEVLWQPGMRRVLEAMVAIREKAPAVLDEASIAAQELSKRRSENSVAVRASEG
jgi:hypothetical protein